MVDAEEYEGRNIKGGQRAALYVDMKEVIALEDLFNGSICLHMKGGLAIHLNADYQSVKKRLGG